MKRIILSEHRCPECNTQMRYFRKARGSRGGRSHSFYASDDRFICPVGEAEVVEDERGHLKRVAGAKHASLRVWQEWELATTVEA